MSAITDTQLISVFRKIEKIVKETEVYSRRVDLLKEAGGTLNSSNNSSIFEDDDELLFPLDIGHEMYTKALKVYMESKTYIESLEKSLNKYVDKIGRHEKASNVTKNIRDASNNNSNSNNKEPTSSSSDDDSGEIEPRKNLKRKSKETPSSGTPNSNGNSYTSISQKTKRVKPPPPAEPSPKEDSPPTTSTKTDTKPDSTKEQQIPNGTLVAAREKSNNSVNWILAKVNGFNQKNQKYEVIDEDEDEPKRFFVVVKDIIQLPSTASVSNNFSAGTKVLAMFPDTTAFYPAVVVSSTKVKNKTTHYTLHFDDDQGDNGQTPSRRVSAQYVVSFSK